MSSVIHFGSESTIALLFINSLIQSSSLLVSTLNELKVNSLYNLIASCHVVSRSSTTLDANLF